jgi:hypothetical protein
MGMHSRYARLFSDEHADRIRALLNNDIYFKWDGVLNLFGTKTNAGSGPGVGMKAGYGDAGLCYKHMNKITIRVKGWPDVLVELKDAVMRCLYSQETTSYKCSFNFVLIHHFKDGWDSMEWEQEVFQNLPVAILYFGEERYMSFKKQPNGPMLMHLLENGSLLIINDTLHTGGWQYGIRTDAECQGQGFAITYRHV